MPNPHNPDSAQDDRDARLGLTDDDLAYALDRATRRFDTVAAGLVCAIADDGYEGDHLP